VPNRLFKRRVDDRVFYNNLLHAVPLTIGPLIITLCRVT
jgi:hypothetical protein